MACYLCTHDHDWKVEAPMLRQGLGQSTCMTCCCCAVLACHEGVLAAPRGCVDGGRVLTYVPSDSWDTLKSFFPINTLSTLARKFPALFRKEQHGSIAYLVAEPDPTSGGHWKEHQGAGGATYYTRTGTAQTSYNTPGGNSTPSPVQPTPHKRRRRRSPATPRTPASGARGAFPRSGGGGGGLGGGGGGGGAGFGAGAGAAAAGAGAGPAATPGPSTPGWPHSGARRRGMRQPFTPAPEPVLRPAARLRFTSGGKGVRYPTTSVADDARAREEWAARHGVEEAPTAWTDPGVAVETAIKLLPRQLRQAFCTWSETHRVGVRGWSRVTEFALDEGRKFEVRYALDLAKRRQPRDFLPVAASAARTAPTHAEGESKGNAPLGRITAELVAEAVRLAGGRAAFGPDNRAGIPGTLHRIAVILHPTRADTWRVTGLTLRVGRPFPGCLRAAHDIVMGHDSVLVLGSPGSGKTSLLREFARLLSTGPDGCDESAQTVVVVDSSMEIAGPDVTVHESVGDARRLGVGPDRTQAQVMVEAVENHTPQVVVIDEIGTRAEAAAAETIARRGVRLVATAHGTTLASLVLNPTLRNLAGKTNTVTLSAEEAVARTDGRTKTVTELASPPVFGIVIELRDHCKWVIHRDVAGAVEGLLSPQKRTVAEERSWSPAGIITTKDVLVELNPKGGVTV